MLGSMEEILRKAKEDNYAVSAPNVQNEDTVSAVIEVAEELNAPMIIDVNYGIAKDFVCFGQFISYLAGKSSVPIAINLDHGNNIEEIMWAVRAGFTSVMLDYSSCSYEKNIKTTKKVVDLLKPLGISVEAEL